MGTGLSKLEQIILNKEGYDLEGTGVQLLQSEVISILNWIGKNASKWFMLSGVVNRWNVFSMELPKQKAGAYHIGSRDFDSTFIDLPGAGVNVNNMLFAIIHISSEYWIDLQIQLENDTYFKFTFRPDFGKWEEVEAWVNGIKKTSIA